MQVLNRPLVYRSSALHTVARSMWIVRNVACSVDGTFRYCHTDGKARWYGFRVQLEPCMENSPIVYLRRKPESGSFLFPLSLVLYSVLLASFSVELEVVVTM